MIPAMKRLGRWLFNFAAAVSLVLCVATVAAWSVTRVGHFYASLGFSGHNRMLECHLQFKGFELFYARGTTLHRNPKPSPPAFRRIPSSQPGWDHEPWDRNLLGFRTKVYDDGGWHWTRFTAIPYWAVILSTIVLPCLSLTESIRNKRLVLAGCCPVCGYDLRATPNRCPECGTVPPAAKGAAP
jgi:hypothetical protein